MIKLWAVRYANVREQLEVMGYKRYLESVTVARTCLMMIFVRQPAL